MKIIPIKTGTIYCNKTVLTYGKGFDKFVEVPVITWFVEQDGHKIIVDTGMCDTAKAHKYHYKNSVQLKEERIDRSLKAKGVSVDEIEIIILTHLHWDHCANLDLFKSGTFYVQREELEYANAPLPPYYSSYESTRIGLSPMYTGVEFELLDGDKEIVPGVHVISTPGHSPGHQSVLVEGSGTRYIIAGDACMCDENLMPDEDKNIEFTMIGRYMDVNSAWKSLERIKSLSGTVLPGHEAAIFRKDVYE